MGARSSKRTITQTCLQTSTAVVIGNPPVR
jgi:hypothetical protein